MPRASLTQKRLHLRERFDPRPAFAQDDQEHVFERELGQARHARQLGQVNEQGTQLLRIFGALWLRLVGLDLLPCCIARIAIEYTRKLQRVAGFAGTVIAQQGEQVRCVSGVVNGPAQHGLEGGSLRQVFCWLGTGRGVLRVARQMHSFGFVKAAPLLLHFLLPTQALLLR